MEVVMVASRGDIGELAAEIIAEAATARPELVLGVATGSSPLPVYGALARRVAAGLDLSRIRAFALDEYVGLDPAHPASYHSVIAKEVVEPLRLDPDRVAVPDGCAADVRAACQAFEEQITAAGGVDIQLLGIGADGHLGFNEPSSSLTSRTRIKTLTEQTRRDNARFFDTPSDVPMHCVTQGLGTILEAGHLLLVASGQAKAEAIAAAVEGPLSANCPASLIQWHQHATVVLDEDAAAYLTHARYYRHTLANKPPWQRF